MALTKWLLINQDLVILNEKDDLEVEELMEEEEFSKKVFCFQWTGKT